MAKIKDAETNRHFLEVIAVLMDGDPEPASVQGAALSFLVSMVEEFESKEYPLKSN